MSEQDGHRDLGERADLDALKSIVDVAGLNLFDVGCGTGWLARELAAAGATVTAFEPEPEQARRNREGPVTAGVSYVEAPAQALPTADASADGVLFSYSLHHVPPALMAKALGEARRVLRAGGFLYVAEPEPRGSFARVIEPFHDETLVQRAAERALAAHARPHFAGERVYSYLMVSRYADFEAFVTDMLAPTHVLYGREQVEAAEVRERFEACRAGDDYRLDQPVRVNVYR